jgi:hypothetical protein
VSERGERLQITAGTATEVEDRERRSPSDVLEERRDVLADIVIGECLAKRPPRARRNARASGA